MTKTNMAKIIEASFSFGRTLSPKAYESIKFQANIKAEVEEGDSVDETFKKLKKIAYEQVAQESVIWENPGMAIRKMNQQGAAKRVSDDEKFVASLEG